MEVLPAVLAFLPRYARGPGVACCVLRAGPTARHNGVVDHREGVFPSPFNSNFNEIRSRVRIYLVGGKVGSCSLHLQGRLQRLFQFHILQLLSNLRSNYFNCSSLNVVDLFFVCFFAIEQYSP